MIPIRDSNPSQTRPYVVYAIIAVNAVVFWYEIQLGLLSSEPNAQLMAFLNYWGVQPVRYSDPALRAAQDFMDLGLPFFTSQFLHGGILHFVGNMWMLWIFGDNVEDWMGHWGFAVFYLSCGIVGGLAHMASSWGSPIPTIGASGAIAGVMGAYLLLYPRARVLTLVPIFFFIQFMQLPAWLFLGFWFALQLFRGMGGGAAASVAWWAHIGGFAFGAAVVLLFGGGKDFINQLTGGGKQRPDDWD